MPKENPQAMLKQEKIKYINEKLSRGSSLSQILSSPQFASEVAKSKLALQKQFEKAGYAYNRQNLDPAATKRGSAVEHSPKEPLMTDDDLDKLADLLDSADVLLNLSAWWQTQNQSALTTDDKLDIPLPTEGDEVRKTIRINTHVWDAWKEFCKRHPGYTEKDLLAKALLWFVTGK